MKFNTLQVFALLAALPLTIFAEQAEKFGDIEVHYNALVTADLRPEVARAYNVDRSKNRGLVTIAVLKKNDVGATVPVKAAVKVNTVNLSLQVGDVPMREINEQTATYYIGSFRIGDQDTLKFAVDVKPESGTPQKFEFSKKFYTN